METVSSGRTWRRIALWIVQLAIVIGIFWILFRNVDLRQLLATFRQANLGLLSAAVGVLVLERIVRPCRLAILLGHSARLLDIIAVQNASQLVNLVLPMRSGEIFLVLMLRKLGIASGSLAVSIVAIDRLMDVVCVLLIFAVTVVLAPGLPIYVGRAVIVLSVLCAITVVVMLAIALSRSQSIAVANRVFTRFMGPDRAMRWRQRLELVIEGFAVLLNPARLIVATILTLIIWGCATLAAWMILLAISPVAPFAAGALAVCLSIIGVTLVSVPAGIGIVHAAYTLAAVSFGVSQEIGLAFAILGHFLTTAVTVVMGVIGLPTVRRGDQTRLVHTR